jgi:hypothetical protein
MNFYDWLRRLLGKSDSMPSGNGMSSPEALRRMAGMLAHTRDEEYTCDEVLALLDQFAEMVFRGEDAAQLMPLVQHHLDMCWDCREEFEAILRILRAAPAS